jgi:hypothetical protein
MKGRIRGMKTDVLPTAARGTAVVIALARTSALKHVVTV